MTIRAAFDGMREVKLIKETGVSAVGDPLSRFLWASATVTCRQTGGRKAQQKSESRCWIKNGTKSGWNQPGSSGRMLQVQVGAFDAVRKA